MENNDCHEHVNHMVLEIVYYFFCVLCLQVLHSWRRENESVMFLLFEKMSSQAYLSWFLFFMTSHGFMAPIGALDYRRMKNFGYLKYGSYAMARSFCCFFGEDKERAKYSNVGYVCVRR
jgi:hypothetical protein